VLILLGAAWFVWSGPGAAWFSPASGTEGIVASGFIEADEVSLAAEIGGRIEALLVNEGDQVKQGQELLRLDQALLLAQIKQAEAAVDTAKAQLAQVQAGARPEDVRQAQATLAQAIAQRDGAKRAWENAKAVRDNPQELEARITSARAQVELARHQLQQALANAKAAEVRKDAFPSWLSTSPEAQAAMNQWWAAEEAVLVAQAALKGAEQGLADLLEMRKNPLTLNAQVDAARAQYETVSAAADAAQARLDAVKAGATKEQIAVAEAQVKQAEAALGVLRVQLSKTVLISPISGLVTRLSSHVGEMASPGTPILTLSALDPVELTIYVPETQIGRVRVGQEVSVQVDSFPGKTFSGRVVFIAAKAEFTPRNVQTKAERVNMVFAVKAQIPNPNHELKAGMPADAEIE